MRKNVVGLFFELQALDKNTLSCLRGDLEKLYRSEVSYKMSSTPANPEVYSRYVTGLETLLDFVCELEGYDRFSTADFTTKSFADIAETLAQRR